MNTYLINTPVITEYGLWLFTGPLDTNKAQQQLKNGFVSAIGHQASADLLSDCLHMPVAMNRQRIAMQPGDQAVVLRLMERLGEGVLLDRQQLQQRDYQLGLLTRLR